MVALLLVLASAACAPSATGGADDGGEWKYDFQVAIPLSGGDFGTESQFQRYGRVEEKLMNAMEEAGGILDGNDIGDGFYTIYVLSDDLDGTVDLMQRELAPEDLPPGSTLRVYEWQPGGRQGGPIREVPVGKSPGRP